ncbi:MAG: hypothetical protein LBJ59_00250 [Zoogloeaceae bacterium]|nr:hypothetical protein [Zoogloeaceae bacterium]
MSEAVGGYDTVLPREEYERLFGAQQTSLRKVAPEKGRGKIIEIPSASAASTHTASDSA